MNAAASFLSPSMVGKFRQGSRASGAAIAFLGFLVLVGWFSDLSLLKSFSPSLATMKANTAVCFMLLGTGLYVFGGGDEFWRPPVLTVCSALTMLIASLTLSQDLFGWELEIDQFLFVDLDSVSRPGRMAASTSVLLTLMGMAYLKLEPAPRVSVMSQWLGLVTSFIALAALCGYLYGVDALYAIPGFGSLSVYSAMALLVLGLSVMAAQPHGGLMFVFAADSPGAALARRLLPLIVIVPIALGWLPRLGQQFGLYDAPVGLALFTASTILTIGVITWFTSKRLILSEFDTRQSIARLTEEQAQLSTARQNLDDALRARQESARTLRQREQLLQAIMENSTAVIYAKDLEGRYLLVNPKFTALFDVSAENMMGKTDYDLFSPAEADAFRAMDKRVVDAGVSLTEEEFVPAADGLHTYLSIKAPLRDAEERIYGIFGISTDITRRKRAEGALRASEERTRLIIENALDAVVTIDRKGIITGWSRQAQKTFGWPREVAMGRLLADTIIPERYRDAHMRGIERFLSNGASQVLNTRLELSALHRDGHEFPVELSITEIRSGGEVAFSAFVRDITNRKQMQEQLIESQQHFQALAESLPHLVWTCRADGYCDFLSRQWVDYTGLPAADQLGYGWADRLHLDDKARVEAAWTEAVARGDLYDDEFRIRRHDGVFRWFRTRAMPLHDQLGNVVKWFGSNTDVDDYKRAEERLNAQLERLNLLDKLTRSIGERQDLHSILQVVVRSLEDHLPLDFCCVSLYDRVDHSLVVSHVGLKGEALAQEMALPEQARLSIELNGLSRCLRGELVYEPDITHLPFSFAQRLSRAGLRSFVASPLVVESNVFGVLISARRELAGFSSPECEFIRQMSEHVALASHQADLYTALQQAYDDLRQTQQAILQQERLKALGQMASGIAHDINNAISPITIYTESLLENEPGLSAKARDYLSTIQRAIDDVAQTVARMRDFYRDHEPQSLTPVKVNNLVGHVVELTRARWSDMSQERGVMIEVVTDFAPDDPDVLGLESDIRESLINLVFNAIDAMPDGGTLTLRTRTPDYSIRRESIAPREVIIEVVDTGLGMDAETRRRCLEPFFTTKGERGTGLGLAMVYGMVQRHGAEIGIDSAPGQGTTVRLTFTVPREIEGLAVQERPRPRPSRLRLLIIDDDPVLLKSLQNVLETDGHLVTQASGGQAGIDAFKAAHASSTPFDAVITDLGMPYVDGRQVASNIRELEQSIPIILLTGWGRRMLDEGVTPPHVDRVLSKPPKLMELRETLFRLTLSRSQGQT